MLGGLYHIPLSNSAYPSYLTPCVDFTLGENMDTVATFPGM